MTTSEGAKIVHKHAGPLCFPAPPDMHSDSKLRLKTISPWSKPSLEDLFVDGSKLHIKETQDVPAKSWSDLLSSLYLNCYIEISKKRFLNFWKPNLSNKSWNTPGRLCFCKKEFTSCQFSVLDLVTLSPRKLFFGPFKGLARTFLPIQQIVPFSALIAASRFILYLWTCCTPSPLWPSVSPAYTGEGMPLLLLLPVSSSFHNGF